MFCICCNGFLFYNLKLLFHRIWQTYCQKRLYIFVKIPNLCFLLLMRSCDELILCNFFFSGGCLKRNFIQLLIGVGFLMPHPGHQTWGPTLTSDMWWWSLETCSNLFIWGPTPTSPTPSPHKQHLVVATETEARMVSKLVAYIILECFLDC